MLELFGIARLRNSRLLKSLASLPRVEMNQPGCGPQFPEETPCLAADKLEAYRGAGSRVNRQMARRKASSSMEGAPESLSNAGKGKDARQLNISNSSDGP